VTIIADPPDLKLRQRVLHGDLQTLRSDLVDMHKLTPKIEEVMEFQRRLIVKSGICARIALFRPLKQILPGLNNFCRFAYLYNKS
jgi:hypothetical protein